MKEVFKLFLTFFKLGLFMFGGGYTMLPMLERELVEKKKYLSQDQLLNFYAVSQCTPGIIAINTATFIGFKVKRIFGAIVATFSLVLGPFIVICILANILNEYANNPYVIKAFTGIKIVIVALVLNTVIDLLKKSIKNIHLAIFFIILLALLFIVKVGTIYIMLGSFLYAILMLRVKKNA